MATLRDIANRANVSVATASNVVSGAVKVSPKLRKRVLDAIAELNYRPNATARTLRTNESRTAGIIVPDIADPFFPDLVRGAEDTLTKSGYTLFIGSSDNDESKEESYFRGFTERQVDGLIVVASTDWAPDFLRRSAPQCPIVYADRGYIDTPGDVVLSDNVGGSQLAVSHLIEMGYNRIATITGPQRLANARGRLDGYFRALRAAGIREESTWIKEGDYASVSGYLTASKLLNLKQRPDAIFVANAEMMLGAFQALQESGVQCPEEIGLVSFGEQDWFTAVRPSITALATNSYQIGESAAELLLKRVRKDPGTEQIPRMLPPKLIIRGSTNRNGNLLLAQIESGAAGRSEYDETDATTA